MTHLPLEWRVVDGRECCSYNGVHVLFKAPEYTGNNRFLYTVNIESSAGPAYTIEVFQPGSRRIEDDKRTREKVGRAIIKHVLKDNSREDSALRKSA